MVFDRLDRAAFYRSLSPNLADAFDWLLRTDFASLPLGRVEIDGDRLFALPQRYTTRPIEQTRWEAHRNYIDIQVILSGRERMDVADVVILEPDGDFDVARDVGFFIDRAAPTTTLVMSTPSFAIFFPHDAHRPTIAVKQPEPIFKIVVKVAV